MQDSARNLLAQPRREAGLIFWRSQTRTATGTLNEERLRDEPSRLERVRGRACSVSPAKRHRRESAVITHVRRRFICLPAAPGRAWAG